MAYDESTADRLRAQVAARADATEKAMFGGLAFLVDGHMACGLNQDHLMVRVGKGAYEAALAEPHAEEMRFTGRPLRGFVTVRPPGYARDEDLGAWVDRAVSFVRTLPPK